MKLKVVYANKAVKELKKLDIVVAQKIVKKISFYSKKDNLLLSAKKLKPPFDDLFRFRVGVYRVVFEVDSKGKITILVILAVRHRKDVYK